MGMSGKVSLPSEGSPTGAFKAGDTLWLAVMLGTIAEPAVTCEVPSPPKGPPTWTWVGEIWTGRVIGWAVLGVRVQALLADP